MTFELYNKTIVILNPISQLTFLFSHYFKEECWLTPYLEAAEGRFNFTYLCLFIYGQV